MYFNLITKFIFSSVLGWQITGSFPKQEKMVIIVVPHTHWMDFIVAILVRNFIREPIHFLGKKELFKGLLGPLFSALGGFPVDRSGQSNTVGQAVSYFKKREIFRLALAPEGTRKKVTHLKTGFYHIAKRAQVPIFPVAFDFENKTMIFHPLFFPGDSQEKDLQQIGNLFKGVRGKIPSRSFEPDNVK